MLKKVGKGVLSHLRDGKSPFGGLITEFVGAVLCSAACAVLCSVLTSPVDGGRAGGTIPETTTMDFSICLSNPGGVWCS